MTSAVDEAAVRRWLVDYLVTNNGCSPEQIDAGASMHDLGVGSRDAVVLTGVLSEFVGRTVSPVDFWQYPTVDALAKFLTGGEGEPATMQVGPADYHPLVHVWARARSLSQRQHRVRRLASV